MPRHTFTYNYHIVVLCAYCAPMHTTMSAAAPTPSRMASGSGSPAAATASLPRASAWGPRRPAPWRRGGATAARLARVLWVVCAGGAVLGWFVVGLEVLVAKGLSSSKWPCWPGCCSCAAATILIGSAPLRWSRTPRELWSILAWLGAERAYSRRSCMPVVCGPLGMVRVFYPARLFIAAAFSVAFLSVCCPCNARPCRVCQWGRRHGAHVCWIELPHLATYSSFDRCPLSRVCHSRRIDGRGRAVICAFQGDSQNQSHRCRAGSIGPGRACQLGPDGACCAAQPIATLGVRNRSMMAQRAPAIAQAEYLIRQRWRARGVAPPACPSHWVKK